MTYFVLVFTTRYHITDRDTIVCAMFFMTKIRDPNWATNVSGPTGQKCGQYLGKMWAGSGTHMGNPHGTHMKMVDKNHMGCSYGPYIVAHMGPM